MERGLRSSPGDSHRPGYSTNRICERSSANSNSQGHGKAREYDKQDPSSHKQVDGGKGLRIAPHKIKAIILSKRKTLPTPNIAICGHQIPVVKETRYLGVNFDSRMIFRSHIKSIVNSTRGIIASLAKLLPNVGDPSINKRKLIINITNSRLLYGVPL